MQDPSKNLYKKILGAKGESLAVHYLKKQGYRILEKNYKCSVGEADIIAMDGDEYVFIEVKTRTSTLYGEPCEAVDFKKQQKYYNIAACFVKEIEKVPVRFDVIEVVNSQINHIKNAF